MEVFMKILKFYDIIFTLISLT